MRKKELYYLFKDKIKKIAYEKLNNEKFEKRLLFFVNDKNEVENFDLTNYDKICNDSVTFDIEKFVEISEKVKNKYVVIAHNHPDESSSPSHGDFYAFKSTKHFFNLNQTYLIEEIIVSKNDISTYSLPEESHIPFFKENANSIISINNSNELNLDFDISKINIPENSTINDIRNFTLPLLKKGYEFFIIDDSIYYSKFFSFKQLYNITHGFKEIYLFGVPNYKNRTQYHRILDFCYGLGVIECFSNEENDVFVPLIHNLKI